MDIEPFKPCLCGASVDAEECPYPQGRPSNDGRQIHVVNCLNSNCGWQAIGWGAADARRIWNSRPLYEKKK